MFVEANEGTTMAAFGHLNLEEGLTRENVSFSLNVFLTAFPFGVILEIMLQCQNLFSLIAKRYTQ